MKEEILSYLREKKEASMDELAQGLGKEKAKDFRNLVKTISEMERKRQLTFSDAGKIQLRKEKQMLTLKGIFHAHKNGLSCRFQAHIEAGSTGDVHQERPAAPFL